MLSGYRTTKAVIRNKSQRRPRTSITRVRKMQEYITNAKRVAALCESPVNAGRHGKDVQGPGVYGLVLGLKADKYESLSEDEARDFIRLSQRTGKLYCHPDVPEGILKQFFWKFINAYNAWDDAVISYHNGYKDKKCQYQGHHWHCVASLITHPTRDSRWGRACLQMSKVGETFFSSEGAINVGFLVSHIIRAPREIIHSKGDKFNQWVNNPIQGPDTSDEESDNDDNWKMAKLKKDANFHRINGLMKLMDKYRIADVTSLKNHLALNDEKSDQRKLSLLQCTHSFDNIARKATDMLMTNEVNLTMSERFDKNVDTVHPRYMTILQSEEWMRAWTQWNSLNLDEFCMEVFTVLTRAIPKRNTFMLEGEPNAYKSFVMRSLLPWYLTYGEVQGTGNYNFAYQGCIDKPLIFMEEPMLEPCSIEQAKLVLEGAPTQVNIKMKGPSILAGTPVIITSNNPLWKWCDSAKEALKARMYHHKVKTYTKEAGLQGKLNPGWWRMRYEKYEDHLHTAAMERYEMEFTQVVAPPEMQLDGSLATCLELVEKECPDPMATPPQPKGKKRPRTPSTPDGYHDVGRIEKRRRILSLIECMEKEHCLPAKNALWVDDVWGTQFYSQTQCGTCDIIKTGAMKKFLTQKLRELADDGPCPNSGDLFVADTDAEGGDEEEEQ